MNESQRALDLLSKLRRDQNDRWRRGERILVESFLTEHREVISNEGQLLGLIDAEIRLRRELAEAPVVEEYLQRFPQLADRLLQMFDVPDEGQERPSPGGNGAHSTVIAGSPSPVAETIVGEREAGFARNPASRPSATARRGRFGDYEILQVIARGGMGVVYKARQVSLGRIVALKMILAGQFASDEDVKRFCSEAEAVAALEHPAIVPIFEVGEYQGQHYFAMGYIDGPSLAAKLRGGCWAPEEAARLVRQIADGVQYAHSRGIVHRDLKPQNVLLTADGQPRITDFGLAKRLEGTSDLTATGQILGTPSYMPPEQARGKTSEVGPLSDVYSLGAILYSLVTGRPPISGRDPIEVLKNVIDREPVSPRQLNPKVSKDLETITLKCLQKDAANRYSSARELADDLDRFLRDEPINARSIGPFERAWRWCRRKPLVASLVAAVACALVTGTAVSMWFAFDANQQAKIAKVKSRDADLARIKAEEQRQTAETARKAAESEKQRAEKSLLRSEWLLYSRQIADAQREWETGNVAAAWRYLDGCRPEFRGWEHRYLYTLFTKDRQRPQGHSGEVTFVAWSPDGKRLASASDDNTVRIWNAFSGNELRTLTGHSDAVRSVSFSPDGKRLASGGDDKSVRVWDAATGNETLTLRGHAYVVRSVAFSPDGAQIASASSDDTIKVWNAVSGHEIHTLRGHRDAVCSVAFSPDGKWIASGGTDKTVRLWDVFSGRELRTFNGHTDTVWSVTFRPDGKQLASGCEDKTIKIWDPSSGRLLHSMSGHDGDIWTVAFSPNGRRVVSGSWDKTIRLWDVASGQEIRTLKGHSNGVRSVAFSPDGKRIASGSRDGTVKVWHAWSGREILALKWHADLMPSAALGPEQKPAASLDGNDPRPSSEISRAPEFHTLERSARPLGVAAFSPDGKRIAGSEVQGSIVNVWDARTGHAECALKGHKDDVHSVAFSPDGKRIVSAGRDAMIKVWDVAASREIRTLKGHSTAVWVVAFSRDGKWLASGSEDKTIKIWDAFSCQEARTIAVPAGEVRTLAFSPDGNHLAGVPADNTIRVWDVTTGRELLTFKGHTQDVPGLAFSPDGKRIVTGSEDRTIRVWDISSGRETSVLKGHAGGILSVAFTPDGRRIASGSDDKTIKLWDITVGQDVLSLKGHPSGVFAVAFGPDGKQLVSVGSDNTIRAWEASRK